MPYVRELHCEGLLICHRMGGEGSKRLHDAVHRVAVLIVVFGGGNEILSLATVISGVGTAGDRPCEDSDTQAPSVNLSQGFRGGAHKPIDGEGLAIGSRAVPRSAGGWQSG